MAGSNDPVNLHTQAAQGLDVHYADEPGPDDRSSDFADGPRTQGFFFEPRSAGVSEPQAATILFSSRERALASAGSAKRMKRALGCDPSRCRNLPGIRAPRLNMTEVCFLSLTCTMVAKSPPSQPNVRVPYFTYSVIRRSAPRMISRTFRIVASVGGFLSANQRSTSVVDFMRAVA